MAATSLDQSIGKARRHTTTALAWVNASLSHESFRGAFIHGLGIGGGAYVGLILWALLLAHPAPEPKKVEPILSTPVVVATQPKQESAPTHHDDNAGGKVTLPLPGLSEDTKEYGLLPIIRTKDKLTPFDAYRQPFAADKLNQPLLAVVMFDYGLSKRESGSILGVMPPEVNVALSPAARDPQDWAQQAFDHGHEIWLDLAVEPANYPLNDAGENTLLTAAPVEQNRANLLKQLGHVAGYAGVLGATDSPYFRSGADADFMAGLLFDRGLGLVVNAPSVAPTIRTQAREQKRPFYAGSFIILDQNNHADDLSAAMSRAVGTAKTNGYAIAGFRPTKAGRTAVVAWLATLKSQGVVLAPLSIIAEKGPNL